MHDEVTSLDIQQNFHCFHQVKQEVAIKVVTNSPNKYDEIQNEMAIFEKFSRHANMVDYFGKCVILVIYIGEKSSHLFIIRDEFKL